MDSLHTIKKYKRKKDLKYLTSKYERLKIKVEEEELLDNETIEYLLHCIDGVFSIINHTKNKHKLDL